MSGENEPRSNRQVEHTLTLDEVLATQPELGPSIPDGGFGWVVFIGTLFFQTLIPCLLVNFGIFLAFCKLENGTFEDKNMYLWSEKILYVPLFFCITRSFFDSAARNVTTNSSTPRLIAVVGTCLTCAGLLFMWMGITGKNDDWLFAPAGMLTGLGASLLMVQCEILLAQYFRMKLAVLNQISQFVMTLGFLVAPIALGHHILNTNVTQVLLWYQAIILQGLVVALFFKKPLYLKSKILNKPYQFVVSNPDDEEDILSKNSRELQIRRQTSTETQVKKIPLDQPSTSTQKEFSLTSDDEVEENKKKWEKFDEVEDDIKYAKLNEWEVFDDEDDKNVVGQRQNWERFEEDQSSPRIVNNLSLAEETNSYPTNEKPSPLFADLPVNNNNTYAYDDEIVAEVTNSNVFMPNSVDNSHFKKHLDVLKEPTFYKSLLMMIANTYSTFVFYALFPSYLYVEADSVNIRHMTGLIGSLALVNLIFLCIAYWIPLDKKKRAVCLWIFYWIGISGLLYDC
ncbi:hypothetical protein TcasGA2_TC010116 [Tribolium castaneum]|uniref:Uncharacterized protein n=1 Tax=Tribolium castaneum TaxID=7070 RepID=D6WSL9_TRICA|nr:PREDICTED: monocarboxylate transporter 7 [Tribolium castaneum]EFA07125.2 hypothetical protein TcasGA2_TC010116 [Tribolium castaneum]|eukprot:XP_008196302.1 PREDICTED: monocarboxylate transporter 7 [Tribolium castaneum]